MTTDTDPRPAEARYVVYDIRDHRDIHEEARFTTRAAAVAFVNRQECPIDWDIVDETDEGPLT